MKAQIGGRLACGDVNRMCCAYDQQSVYLHFTHIYTSDAEVFIYQMYDIFDDTIVKGLTF